MASKPRLLAAGSLAVAGSLAAAGVAGRLDGLGDQSSEAGNVHLPAEAQENVVLAETASDSKSVTRTPAGGDADVRADGTRAAGPTEVASPDPANMLSQDPDVMFFAASGHRTRVSSVTERPYIAPTHRTKRGAGLSGATVERFAEA